MSDLTPRRRLPDLLAATAVSATFQAYRAAAGSHPGVGRFGVGTPANCLTWSRWRSPCGPTSAYYPTVYSRRRMERVDSLEGTVFTAALAIVLAVSACAWPIDR